MTVDLVPSATNVDRSLFEKFVEAIRLDRPDWTVHEARDRAFDFCLGMAEILNDEILANPRFVVTSGTDWFEAVLDHTDDLYADNFVDYGVGKHAMALASPDMVNALWRIGNMDEVEYASYRPTAQNMQNRELALEELHEKADDMSG